MQVVIPISLKKAISKQRLTSFGEPEKEPEAVQGRYMWNTKLSESFYPALSLLEVALRNTVNEGASTKYGSDWLTNARVLAAKENEAVEKAKQRLERERKQVTNSRLVAELNFGFWTSLFDVRYEQKLWPSLLGTCFPSIPRAIRTRKTLSKALNDTRNLRNRIFHYEPIWHWTDLDRHHSRIINILSWVSTDLVALLAKIDRFEQVNKERPL
jgi:hypothetical protein